MLPAGPRRPGGDLGARRLHDGGAGLHRVVEGQCRHAELRGDVGCDGPHLVGDERDLARLGRVGRGLRLHAEPLRPRAEQEGAERHRDRDDERADGDPLAHAEPMDRAALVRRHGLRVPETLVDEAPLESGEQRGVVPGRPASPQLGLGGQEGLRLSPALVP